MPDDAADGATGGEADTEAHANAEGADGDRSDADTASRRFDPDPERASLLRETAEDVRGDTSESEQVAAFLYRVSDLYDPDEETTPEEIHRNVRTILRIEERGGLERDG